MPWGCIKIRCCLFSTTSGIEINSEVPYTIHQGRTSLYGISSPSANCLHHTTVHCNDPTKNQDQPQPPIHPSPAHTDVYKFNFFPRCVRTWSILSLTIVKADSVDTFKAALNNSFRAGNMYMVPPRDIQQRPRLGSTDCIAVLDPCTSLQIQLHCA